MLVNFTNHPSSKWAADQLNSSKEYGEIVDVPFPNVNAHDNTAQIHAMARKIADQIIEMRPDFVLCQGEFCLAFSVATLLKKAGIHVGGACSERQSVEKVNEDGATERVSIFKFVKYREY